MSDIRFFTDEDVYSAVAEGLRRAGFDAISTPEAGRMSELDESQLEWSANEGRAIVTFNVGHFVNLHTDGTGQNAASYRDHRVEPTTHP